MKILHIIFGVACIIIVSDILQNIEDKPNPNNNIIFIWNDDEESIPQDGSLIVIEKTVEDTVYIGPLTYK